MATPLMTTEQPLDQGSENLYALALLAAGGVAALWFGFMRPAAVVPPTCPVGTTGVWPNCVPIVPTVCPPGTTGTPPNCVPVVVPPTTCPPGTTGTPPNCVPVVVPPATRTYNVTPGVPETTAGAGTNLPLTFTVTNQGGTTDDVVIDLIAQSAPAPTLQWQPSGNQQVLASAHNTVLRVSATMGPGQSITVIGQSTVVQHPTGPSAFAVFCAVQPAGTPPEDTSFIGNYALGTTIVHVTPEVPPPAPQVCPVGTTGTWPNCVPINPPPPPPVGAPTLGVTVQGIGSMAVGQVVGLPFSVTNNGPGTAFGVSFQAAFSPDDASFVAWGASPFYNVAANVVTVSLGDMPAGQTRTGAVLIQGRSAGVLGAILVDILASARGQGTNTPVAGAGVTVVAPGVLPG